MRPTLRGTAFHEAGHAVVSFRLGFLPAGVAIVPGETHHGVRALGVESSDPTWAMPGESILDPQETAEAAAVACYAGLAAEAHFGLGAFSWTPHARHGAWEDDRLAREEYPSNNGVPPLGWRAVARCRRRAVRLVARHADEIRVLAKALLRFRRLSGAEIEAVLGERSIAAWHGAESLKARARLRAPLRYSPR